MIRRALAALLVLTALAACSSSNESGTVDTRPSGSGAVPKTQPARSPVLVVGDSNLFESSEQVDAALRAAGLDPTLRGVPSLGLKDLDGYWLGELPALLETHPAVVVVALGTNDTTTRDDVDAFATRLDTMMRALGDRPVVWVTHVQVRPLEVAGGAAAINEAIRAAPARWPKLTVLDRTPTLTNDPSLVRDDGLHFTAAGMQAFANDLAVAALGRVQAGVSVR